MTRKRVPYGVTDDQEGLYYLAVDISYAGRWVNINDGDRYKISAEGTRDAVGKSWRKVSATSPILGGDYLIHAVPDMVVETISVWVHGVDQTDLADNLFLLQEMFEQLDYRIRWTTNEYREYWRCQLADSSVSRGQVWTHNTMAVTQFTVPRYPNVTRERVD